jgi:hypothetical protein
MPISIWIRYECHPRVKYHPHTYTCRIGYLTVSDTYTQITIAKLDGRSENLGRHNKKTRWDFHRSAALRTGIKIPAREADLE